MRCTYLIVCTYRTTNGSGSRNRKMWISPDGFVRLWIYSRTALIVSEGTYTSVDLRDSFNYLRKNNNNNKVDYRM